MTDAKLIRAPTVDDFSGLAMAGEPADYFQTPEWFRVLRAHGIDGGAESALCFDRASAPRAALATETRVRRIGPLPLRIVRSLTNYYSCSYGPVVAKDAGAEGLPALARAMCRRDVDAVEIDSLDVQDGTFARLRDALSTSGWPMHAYFHFGNWYEPVAGRSSQDWLDGRNGRLRNLIKRRGAKLAKSSGATFRIVEGGAELDAAIRDYETVYARSWQRSEPHPAFMPALIRSLAKAGALRLALAQVGDEPAAAQVWIVWNGKATIFKLAQDERFDALSIGSLLTWHAMRHVLDTDRVAEVDFGRGDDPYKSLWLTQRRERWGVMAFNPRRLGGLAAAARHIGAARVRALVRRPAPA